MAACRQAFLTRIGVQFRRQQDVNYVWPRLPKHGLEIVEYLRNPILLLDYRGAIQVNVADGNCLYQVGYRLESWTVAFRDVSCAKKRDTESPG